MNSGGISGGPCAGPVVRWFMERVPMNASVNLSRSACEVTLAGAFDALSGSTRAAALWFGAPPVGEAAVAGEFAAGGLAAGVFAAGALAAGGGRDLRLNSLERDGITQV